MTTTVFSAALPLDERLQIRKNRLTGSADGRKRVCIVTGTHGDELEGQYVCYRLNRLLQAHPEALEGIVDIYPALNPLGIDSIMRGIPGFDLDMNRIFPGNPDGALAEAAAHAVVDDMEGADMVIDIHSSNIFLREVPQVRINVMSADSLLPFARLLHVDFIWIHEAATVLESTLAHSLNSIGTPCLVVEMGVGMRINRCMGDRLVAGILNLLSALGMWHGPMEPSPQSQPLVSVGDEVAFVNAEASGLFLTDRKNDTEVEKGDEIGCIVSSLTGDILHRVLSPVRGYLFTLRAYPVVYDGSLLARIHCYGEKGEKGGRE